MKALLLLLLYLPSQMVFARVDYQAHTAFISGVITPETAQQFAKVTQQQHITAVHLNSIGGNLNAALKIARFVATHRIHTHAGKMCNSACSILFLSGHFPTASAKSVICIHQAYRNINGRHIGEPRHGHYFKAVANTLAIERGKKRGAMLTEMMWDVSPNYCSPISTGFGYQIRKS